MRGKDSMMSHNWDVRIAKSRRAGDEEIADVFVSTCRSSTSNRRGPWHNPCKSDRVPATLHVTTRVLGRRARVFACGLIAIVRAAAESAHRVLLREAGEAMQAGALISTVSGSDPGAAKDSGPDRWAAKVDPMIALRAEYVNFSEPPIVTCLICAT